MPQVTINEIDQSRYVVNSQRAPLIALVPIISTFGDTESAKLIQNESDFNNYFGTDLATPIEGDITRKYALNLLNSGVSILVKRIKPDADFEEGKSATLNDLYADMSVGVVENTPEQEETGTQVQAYLATDGTYYVPTGTTENPSYDHYSSSIEKLVPMYIEAEATDNGAKQVVPDNTIINKYIAAEQGDDGALVIVNDNTISNKYVTAQQDDEGALLIVANDAENFDSETQVKLETVSTDLPEAQAGEYVKLTEVDTFDANTQVKLSTVIADLPEAQVDQYVKVTEVDTFNSESQVKISNVITDLPNVQVNNYVIFVNDFDASVVATEIANGTYTEATITIRDDSSSDTKPEEETTTTYKMKLSATAKYFGSYGNNIGIRIFKNETNSSDVLSRESKKTVTINTYRVVKRLSLSDSDSTDNPNILSNTYIKSAKLVDSLTFRIDDFSLDNSINKLPQFINQFSLLSDLSITNEDGSAVSNEDYENFFDDVVNILDGNIFMLTGGKDYFETVTEKNEETGEDVVTVKPTTLPLDQFYRSLADIGTDNTYSNLNAINDFWEDFKDPYIYDFDFICASGFTNIYSKDGETLDFNPDYTSIHANMIKLAYSRGDAVACLDTPKEYTHVDMINYFKQLSNSDTVYSYATAHGPWCKVRDVMSGNYMEMPASLIFLATIGANLTKNSEAQIWYAPAGVSRASTNIVVEPKYEIGSTILNEWQNSNSVRVNPIMKILTYGYTIYGNSTLMQDETGYTKSALQSLGTRVLCNVVKKAIFSICVALTFEPNDYILWAEFKTRLSKTLEQMKINGGIEDYQIVMDDTTVTDEAKNDLKVPGKVFISPTRPAEYFDIDFTITQSGVTFDESISTVIS